MAVGGRLGEATVDVVADTSGFGNGLPAKLRAALARTDREARRAGRRIGKEIADSIGDELVRQTPALRRRINAMLRGITVTARIRVRVDVDIDQDQLNRLIARLRGNLISEITGGAGSAFRGMEGLFGGLVPRSPQQAAVMLSVASIAGATLAGVVNSVGRELLNVVKLAGFLPGILATVLAATFAVKIGMSGVSEAIGAAFEKDPTKFNEALKGLTPSARAFVIEINKAMPVFDRMKAAVQESMFAPMKGVFTEMIQNIGPTLIGGLQRVAGAIGEILGSIGMVFADPAMKANIDAIFRGAANLLGELGGPLASVLRSLLLAAGASMPSLERLGGVIGGLLKKFADWLEGAIADGRFQGWLDSAQETLDEILYLVGEVGKLFGVLFDDANNEGSSFLGTLGGMIQTFREFVESREGQYAFEGIAEAAKVAGWLLFGIVVVFGIMVAAVGSFVAAVKDAINWLRELLAMIPGLGGLSKGSGGSTGGGDTFSRGGGNRFNRRAAGGIINRPELSIIGEAGPEVIIPLTRPGRARQLVEQSGLSGALGQSGGTRVVSQTFYLGEKEISARMVETVESRIGAAVSDAAYGVRSVA